MMFKPSFKVQTPPRLLRLHKLSLGWGRGVGLDWTTGGRWSQCAAGGAPMPMAQPLSAPAGPGCHNHGTTQAATLHLG